MREDQTRSLDLSDFDDLNIRFSAALQRAWPELHFRAFDILGSTNTEALRLIETKKAIAPELLLAREQSAGRGTNQRGWWSPRDAGLWFTLNDDLATLPQPTAFLPGLAVVRALVRMGYDAHLKWPHDILIGAAKVGGCLIQIGAAPKNTPNLAAIGIGLNVSIESFPPEIDGPAASLRSKALSPGQDHSPSEQVLATILDEYRTLRAMTDLRDEYRRHDRLIGRVVRARRKSSDGSSDKIAEYEVQDLSADGFLLVRDSEGSVVRWTSGDHARILIEPSWASSERSD